ncbi:MAG: DUF6503 family protein [Bacteroidota bacterium]
MPRCFAAAALLAAALVAGCTEPDPAGPSVQPAPPDAVPEPDSVAVAVIGRTRAAHGSDLLDASVVTFDFRGRAFRAERSRGRFAYARTWDEDGRTLRDVLDNGGVRRTVDGTPVALSEAEALAVEEAVNSVVYFALIPHGLADDAVQPRHLGSDSLGGEVYDLVEVTFRPEGGGRDYQDRFLYWVHREQSTVDYLAYSYEVNGGGARFRRAVNARAAGGARFADYENYTADPLAPPLEALGRMWEADSLRLLSEVVLDRVRVQPIAR